MIKLRAIQFLRGMEGAGAGERVTGDTGGERGAEDEELECTGEGERLVEFLRGLLPELRRGFVLRLLLRPDCERGGNE